MSTFGTTPFIKRQIYQIQQGGSAVLVRKIKILLENLFYLPLYILAIPAVVIIRLIRPWMLVRIGGLISSRIGHFAANTELYLCELDAEINVPTHRHVDIFYMAYKPICNQQLAIMWRKMLRIWPNWILGPIDRVNRLIPGGMPHEIGNNTQHDRDVHNLLDRFPPHLQLTAEEELRGAAGLQAMGIPIGSPFVCLTVRDSAYLAAHLGGGDCSYHNYRDSDVQNCVLAAEELAYRGYFIIRMGAKVHAPINSSHPRIIDCAANGMRSDFMDIYLGAKCEFCISTSTGWDAVPIIFRRPVVYVNQVPMGYLNSFSRRYLGIMKHHFLRKENRELTLQEIFTHGVGFCLHSSGYLSKGVDLIENTPEEIKDVVIEMADRLKGTGQPHEVDEALQCKFWEIFPVDAVGPNGLPLHGEIRSRYGAAFLRDNQDWLL